MEKNNNDVLFFNIKVNITFTELNKLSTVVKKNSNVYLQSFSTVSSLLDDIIKVSMVKNSI